MSSIPKRLEAFADRFRDLVFEKRLVGFVLCLALGCAVGASCLVFSAVVPLIVELLEWLINVCGLNPWTAVALYISMAHLLALTSMLTSVRGRRIRYVSIRGLLASGSTLVLVHLLLQAMPLVGGHGWVMDGWGPSVGGALLLKMRVVGALALVLMLVGVIRRLSLWQSEPGGRSYGAQGVGVWYSVGLEFAMCSPVLLFVLVANGEAPFTMPALFAWCGVKLLWHVIADAVSSCVDWHVDRAVRPRGRRAAALSGLAAIALTVWVFHNRELTLQRHWSHGLGTSERWGKGLCGAFEGATHEAERSAAIERLALSAFGSKGDQRIARLVMCESSFEICKAVANTAKELELLSRKNELWAHGLQDMLRNETNRAARLWAVGELKAMGTGAWDGMPTVALILGERDVVVRKALEGVAEDLGLLTTENEEWRHGLQDILRSETHRATRLWALGKLKALGANAWDEASVAALILSERDAEVCRALEDAARAFGLLTARNEEWLRGVQDLLRNGPHQADRIWAVSELKAMGADAWDGASTADLVLNERDVVVRKAVKDAAKTFGLLTIGNVKWVRGLHNVLRGGVHPTARLWAVGELKALGAAAWDGASTAALILNERDAVIREAMENAAGEFGLLNARNGEWLHGLQNVITTGTNQATRVWAIERIGALGCALFPDSGELLRRMVSEDRDATVRTAASDALVRLSEVPELGMRMVLVKPGSFMMGAANGSGRQSTPPMHRVSLTNPFLIGQYEVTQEEYERVVAETPSRFKGAHRPVENVSWIDAMKFCRMLTRRERKAGRLKPGQAYRLPTEAEWEYCSRAGTPGEQHAEVGSIAWSLENSGRRTHEVGEKLPNAWGIYDMLGNVWEWCSDWYDGSHSGASPDTDPRGPASGSYRLLRGGSWYSRASNCRSAVRGGSDPSVRLDSYGFRIVLSH